MFRFFLCLLCFLCSVPFLFPASPRCFTCTPFCGGSRSMHFINAIFYAAMIFTSLFQQDSPYEWNKKSTLSTDHQVEFPGIVLEPGVYTIRLKESSEKRSSVQILNQDETQLLATVLAVPDHRVRPEDNSEFTFHVVKTAGPQPV